jgi:molybdopterin molybdotransferase
MSDESAGRRTSRYREHRPWQDLETMLSVDEARERILSRIRVASPVEATLLDALGLVLAEDVVSESSTPPFRNSAMDGYAVRSIDIEPASFESPVTLRVVGELPAGAFPERHVEAGEAIRIMTGAAMPTGADTVIRFEETSEGATGRSSRPGDVVEIHRARSAGSNVREAGEDIAPGDVILTRGALIGSTELGLLASINRSAVRAHPRPKVGILATGDEVVDPGDPIRPGQIRNSNNFMLYGLVRESGGDPEILGIARDTASDIKSRLARASQFDLILTSGGVSLGDYDVVKDVLQADGRVDLWQVRIKPGKPMAFGSIGETPLIGLPGNPVAAFVAFLQFGAPAIKRMRGLEVTPERTLKARLLREHENRGRRRHYVRGWFREQDGCLVVEPVAVQGSGVLSSVARANCLFVIPEEFDHAPAGLEVDVIPLP